MQRNNIIQQQQICQCCDTKFNNCLRLPCEHLCCKGCLRYSASNEFENNFKKNIMIEHFSCPVKMKNKINCDYKLTFKHFIDQFGEDSFNQLISDAMTCQQEPTFQCMICQDNKISISDSITFLCEDKACIACGINYLENAYEDKKGNLLISEIKCFMGDQCNNQTKQKLFANEQMIKAYLGIEQLNKISLYTAEKLFTSDQCPLCNTFFDNSLNSYNKKVKCPNCNKNICLKCHAKDHQGDCQEQNRNYLREIRQVTGYTNLSFCPNPSCNLQVTKDSGCEHVKCEVCQTEFCFQCCAFRGPTMTHGTHYHRKECIFYQPWIDPTTNKEILEDPLEGNCPQCQKTKQVCKRPETFAQFLQSISQKLNFSSQTIKKIRNRQKNEQ